MGGSLRGMGSGLGETGIGEWAKPKIVGTGSGVDGDGGTFGLEAGEGHKVADGAEEEGSTGSPPPSESVDSSCGSTTVGSDEGGDCGCGLRS